MKSFKFVITVIAVLAGLMSGILQSANANPGSQLKTTFIPTPFSVNPDKVLMVSKNGKSWTNGTKFTPRVGKSLNPYYGETRVFFRFKLPDFLPKVNLLSAELVLEQSASQNKRCSFDYSPGFQINEVEPLWKAHSAWPGPAKKRQLSLSTVAHGRADLCPGYEVIETEITDSLIANQDQKYIYIGLQADSETDYHAMRKFFFWHNYRLSPKINATFYEEPELSKVTLDGGKPENPENQDELQISNSSDLAVLVERKRLIAAGNISAETCVQILNLDQSVKVDWQCTEDSIQETTLNLRFNFRGFSDGDYIVRARVANQNESNYKYLTRPIRVDTIGPVTPQVLLTPPAGGWNTSTSGSAKASAGSPDTVGFVWSFSTPINCSLGTLISLPLGETEVTFSVQPTRRGFTEIFVAACDAAGNASGRYTETFMTQ